MVKGIAITEYCDRNQLPVRQRLELFVQVCQAAQHAHQKGIIHRDLKPSNVLVRLHDDVPVPKVIDFGVAKALHHQLTERTIYTRFAQVIGTPLYMSPEQAELGGVDIDTRTDVYSLGVLLYELLTGVTPFDKRRFDEAAYDEIRRIIREDEPPKPSTRISTLGDNVGTISQNRKTDRKKLGHVLRGELDWIVMKAIEKDRTRRYETALGFANDVQRFLNEEAVLACPPSTAYRLRKFVQRNRGPVIAASALLLVLCLGLVGTTIGLTWATREARNARLAEGLANSARDKAQELADQNQKLIEGEREARSEAEYVGYVSQIHVAAANLDQGDAMVARNTSLHTAREALLATVPRYRNWEWGYLVAQAWPPPSDLDPDTILSREPGVSVSEFWAGASARVIFDFHHEGLRTIGGIEFSKDGTRIVTTPADGTVRLWDAQTGDSAGSFPGSLSVIGGIAFSHDDLFIAAGGVGGDTSIFDAQTRDVPGSPKKPLWTHTALDAKPVSTVWFSPDDTRLVAAHFDGVVRVWETDSGREITSYDKHAELVQSLRFLADGETVVSASRDGWVRVWELETGREVEPPRRAPGGDGLSVQAISPNPREVAAGFFDGSRFIWDRETGDKLRDLSQGSAGIQDLIFSRDGTCLLATEGEGSVSVLDTASGEQVRVLAGHLLGGAAPALSPDGERIVTFSRDGTCKVWAPVVPETDERIVMSSGHEDAVLQAAFSPDGKRIVTASYDKTAKVWDTATQELITTFQGHKHELLKAEFSPDGRRVASVSSRGTVRVWDAQTGEEIFSRAGSDDFLRAASSEYGLRGNILNFSAVFSSSPFARSAPKLVVNDGQDMVVIDSTDGRELFALEDNPAVGWPVIGPFDKRVATITDTLNEVHVWQLETGRKLFALTGHDGQAFFVEFSRDGSRLVTGSMDKTAIVWDAKNGEELFKLKGHEEFVTVARFSPDGKRIATASGATSTIWDASTGETLSTFSGHAGKVTNVEFSPDGTRVLTTSFDATVRIWDPKGPDARELVRLVGEGKLLYGTWSPDGRRVLTCWNDGKVRLFEAFPWEQLAGTAETTAIDERIRLWREGRSMK